MNLINTIKNIFRRKTVHLENDVNNNQINNSDMNNVELNNNNNTINNSNNFDQLNNTLPNKQKPSEIIQERDIINKQQNELQLKQTTDNKIITDVQTVTIQEFKNKLNTIWDVIKVKENTQAEHIIKSIPTDNWTTMDEIRQNIKIEFGIEYKNEKSLYPYLKTLTDINLIKVNNTGKKRTWKKNIIIIDNK